MPNGTVVQETLGVDSIRDFEVELDKGRESPEPVRKSLPVRENEWGGGESVTSKLPDLDDVWVDAPEDQIYYLDGVKSLQVVGLGAKTVLLQGEYKGELVYRLAQRINSSGEIQSVRKAVFREFDIFSREAPESYDSKDFIVITDITAATQAYLAIKDRELFKSGKVGVVYLNNRDDNYIDFNRVSPQLLQQVLDRFTIITAENNKEDSEKLFSKMTNYARSRSQSCLYLSGREPIIITEPLTPVDIEFLLLLRTSPELWMGCNFRNLYFENLSRSELIHLHAPLFLPTLVLHNQDLSEMKKFEELDWPIIVVSGNTKLPRVNYGNSSGNGRDPRKAWESLPNGQRLLQKLSTESLIPEVPLPPEGKHQVKLFIFQKALDDLVEFADGSPEITSYESKQRAREIFRNNLDRLLCQFNGSIMILDENTMGLLLELEGLNGISSFAFRNRYNAREFKKRNPELRVYEPGPDNVTLAEVQPSRSAISRLINKIFGKKSQ